MNASNKSTMAGIWAILLFFPFLLQGQQIDSQNSRVEFSVSNLGISKVNGTIEGMHGNVDFDPGDPASASFDVCVRPETIDTGNGRRDQHLREKDFFHVKEYPEVCIVSDRITRNSEGYLLTGHLTIKDTRKRITIPFTHNNGTLEGKLTLTRQDYDLGTSATGSFAIGDEVEVVIKAEIL